MYQPSTGPPERVLACAVSKKPYVFFLLLDKYDIGSDHSVLLMETYFISLAFTLSKVNFFSRVSRGAVIVYSFYTRLKILNFVTVSSCVLFPFLDSNCENALFYSQLKGLPEDGCLQPRHVPGNKEIKIYTRVVLTVHLSILTNSTVGYLSSKYTLNTSLTKPYDKKERKEQRKKKERKEQTNKQGLMYILSL
jgi:hypothetical protein